MKILVAVGAGQVKDSYFTPEAVKELEKLGEIVYNETGRQAFTKEELMEQIVDVDVVMTGWGSPRIDPDVLAVAKKLKVHAHTAGSVASYTCKEEFEKGIIVLSGNDVFAQSVAEGCLVYTINAMRRNEEYLDAVHSGGWKIPDGGWNSGLVNKKIGIVGFGTISRYYMRLLSWFTPDLYLASEYATEEDAKEYGAKLVSKEYIFANCKVISLHAAWNEETENSIGADLLKLIQPGAFFVNTARAQIVNKEDFYAELETGRFTAVLDVFHDEPLPVDDPIRSMKNVIAYPHIAGPTFDMRELVTYRLIEALKNIKEGKPFGEEITYDYAIRMSVH